MNKPVSFCVHRAVLASMLLVAAADVAALSAQEQRKAERFWSSVGGQTATAADALRFEVGAVTHTLSSVEVVDTIPASWTIPQFARVAKPKSAPEGHVWYVIKGEARNNGDRNVGMSSAGYRIIDGGGNEHEVDVKTVTYQTSDTVLTYKQLTPGKSGNWIGFYPVPKDANDLRLRVSDLSFVPKSYAYVALPDPIGAARELALVEAPPAIAKAAEIPPPPIDTTAAAPSSTSVPPSAPTQSIDGLGVTTGLVEHALLSIERYEVLPKSLWSSKWRDSIPPEVLAAPAGHVWYRIVGQAKNNADDDRSFKASFVIVDQSGREFKANTRDTQFYVEEGESLLATNVAPGETRQWVGYFAVADDSRGLQLKLDDLTFLAEHTAFISLPDETAD